VRRVDRVASEAVQPLDLDLLAREDRRHANGQSRQQRLGERHGEEGLLKVDAGLAEAQRARSRAVGYEAAERAPRARRVVGVHAAVAVDRDADDVDEGQAVVAIGEGEVGNDEVVAVALVVGVGGEADCA
jgi:hypothetical protein